MPITTDVRKYGETALEQGKAALTEARKPWYAAVGAGELAYDQLTQLPVEVQARLRRLQAGAAQIDTAHLRSAVETAAGQAVETYGAYASQARETYESLAHRGELAVRRLRRSPEVKHTFTKAEEFVAEAGEVVAEAEEKVTKPGRMTTGKPAASRTPRKTPVKRTTKA